MRWEYLEEKTANQGGLCSNASVSLNTYNICPKGKNDEVTDKLETLASSLSWRGKCSDVTGFVWLGARYYTPGTGRFLSTDPFGFEGSLDLYSFANGDPINYFDPDGRLTTEAYKATKSMTSRINDNFQMLKS